MSPFLRHLPNVLTASRLGFAAGFLILLYAACDAANTGGAVPYSARTELLWSFILFVIAGITDVVDGKLARRLGVTGRFGRTFDPLVDKILIVGGFTLMRLCFSPANTGLYWWMVGVVIGRELLVTVMRYACEARGYEFPATRAGKLKMFLQSFALGTIVIYLGWMQGVTWATVFRDVMVWTAVLATIFSAVVYFGRLRHLTPRHNDPAQSPQTAQTTQTTRTTQPPTERRRAQG